MVRRHRIQYTITDILSGNQAKMEWAGERKLGI
jgi:hypothetical protein